MAVGDDDIDDHKLGLGLDGWDGGRFAAEAGGPVLCAEELAADEGEAEQERQESAT